MDFSFNEAEPEDSTMLHSKTLTHAVFGLACLLAPQVTNAQRYGPDTCKQGFVWREAIPSDHACVPPNIRTLVAQENAYAASRRNPTGRYGSDTCIAGYVWREAFPGDHVCVTPARRTATREENQLAASRRVR